MVKKLILIVLSIIWLRKSAVAQVGAVWKIAQWGIEVATVIERIDAGEALDGSDDQKKIVRTLDNINYQLSDFQTQTKEKLADIEALIRLLPDELKIQRTMDDIKLFIAKTEEKWDLFGLHMGKKTSEQEFSLLAKEIEDNVAEKLQYFRTRIIPSSDVALFMLMAKQALKQIDTLCDKGETFHDAITYLFYTVLQTEIKAHILSRFAFRVILNESGEKLWSMRSDNLKVKLREQFKEYIKVYRASLNSPELPYIRACDPPVWKRDENFYELDGLQQQTVYSKGCEPYECTPLQNSPPACSPQPLMFVNGSSLNNHTSCEGTPYNCQKLNDLGVPTVLEICVWKSGPYRVRFIKDADSTYGTDKVNFCPSGDLYRRHSAAWIVIGYYGHLSIPKDCSCQCRTKKWRIAIVPRFSDHQSIIVGVRFKTNGTIIYIQIAQARLGPNGSLSNSSWLPVQKVMRQEGDSRIIAIENAIFYLEDIILPPGYVLKGIGFQEEWRLKKWPKPYSLELYGAKVDFERGIIEGMKVFKHPMRYDRKAHIVAGKSSINMEKYERSHVVHAPYHEVRLRQSDLSHDFGQSTLPLFDAVPVLTNPLLPIGGVGLFVKNQREHAGFLSLRLFPINYTYFMDASLQKYNFILSPTGKD